MAMISATHFNQKEASKPPPITNIGSAYLHGRLPWYLHITYAGSRPDAALIHHSRWDNLGGGRGASPNDGGDTDDDVDDQPYWQVVNDWNPSPGDVPLGLYPEAYVSAPTFTTLQTNFRIQSVFIAPPIHPIAYKFGDDDGPHYGQAADYYGVLYTATYQSVEMEFYNPGVYIAKLHFVDPNIADQIMFWFVGAGPADGTGDGGPSSPRTQQMAITSSIPQAGQDTLVVIENTTHDATQYDQTAKGFVVGYQLASNVDQFIALVNNQYANNNNHPITVVLIAHGYDSLQSIGAGGAFTIPNQFIQDFNDGVQKIVQSCAGEISNMLLLGCEIALTVDTKQNHLMRSLSEGLCTPTVSVTVSAWDQCVTACDPGWVRPGYFAVNVTAKKRVCVNGAPVS
jgi:hypothetical protein